MSMNLVYDYHNESGEYLTCEEFQFQTPTELTRKVLSVTNKHEQLAIIANWMKDRWEPTEVEEIMSEISDILSSPNVVLGEI